MELDASRLAEHAEFGRGSHEPWLCDGGLPAASALRLYDAFRRHDTTVLLHADELCLGLYDYHASVRERRVPP